MGLSFYGAAGEVTGSRFLIESGEARVLIDAGLFQGHRREALNRSRDLPFDPKRLSAVILTHAHLDHCGALPLLAAHGFTGPAYATPSTVDLCRIMLLDAAHIQEEDARFFNKLHARNGQRIEPLYTTADAERALTLLKPMEYERSFAVHGLRARLINAGHVLGSAMVLMEVGKRRVLFTGDLGGSERLLLKPPKAPAGVHDLVIETTYGGRVHSPVAKGEQALANAARRAFETGGRLLIPSFALARTQEIVFLLARLRQRALIPDIKVIVDSPMASAITDVFIRNARCPSVSPAALREAHANASLDVRYIRDVEESKALNLMPEPMIIVSASGMCEGGRILHHLRNNIGSRRTTVLLVGFQAQGTLGRRLVDGFKKVKIYGEEHRVAAQIESIDSLSAHADRDELLKFVRALKPAPQRVFLVHGQEDERRAFNATLESLGYSGIYCPKFGDSVAL